MSGKQRIVWFYDMNATRNPAGVTRHAMAMRDELAQASVSGLVDLTLCSGRINDPDILAQWQRQEEIKKCELPLSARNMLRFWRMANWPPMSFWSGPAEWIYSPAEFSIAKGRAKLAVTSHDLLQDLQWQPPRRMAMLDQLFPKADLVLSVSQFNTNQLLRNYPFLEGRIAQVPNAPDTLFKSPATAEERAAVRKQIGLPAGKPFLLSVANFQPRKNLHRLVKAAAMVSEIASGEIALVLVGEGLHDEIIRLEATIQECARPRMLVQITGYLQGESLRAAYAEAAGLVFPSLCESFGIPVLEAMSQNCPLALANSTSLPEIAGEAAFYFDPTSEEAIASSIRQLIDDQTGVEERIEIGKKLVAQYSWKKSVDDLLQAIRNQS